jgi:hypothetical protein
VGDHFTARRARFGIHAERLEDAHQNVAMTLGLLQIFLPFLAQVLILCAFQCIPVNLDAAEFGLQRLVQQFLHLRGVVFGLLAACHRSFSFIAVYDRMQALRARRCAGVRRR